MALITDLGVDGGGIAQPRLKHKWAVTFQNMAGDSDPLRLNAINASRPKLEFEEVVLDRYNSKAYIAGKHVFQTVDIQFEDDLNGGVTSAIQAQLELQQKVDRDGYDSRVQHNVSFGLLNILHSLHAYQIRAGRGAISGRCCDSPRLPVGGHG